MTSVTNSSGLNYQNGINPLGRKVRALEAEVISLRSEINLLKAAGGTSAAAQQTTQAAAASSTINIELDMIKRELAILKASGYGKGEKGDKGDKGDKGEKGEPGPMTYIAMPANAIPPAATTTSSS